MSAAAAIMDSDTTKVTKHFHITLTVNIKRTKEEVDFANRETDRLHALISEGKEVEWAKERITKVQEMVLLPTADQLKKELTDKLNVQDDQE